MRIRSLICLALLLGFAHATSAEEQPPVDLLLRGGTVYDGSGGEAITGDVAIRGDRIVAVGDLSQTKADLVLDCRGLIVAPGFIDLHSHSDRGITRPTTRANINFLMQGCTTVVTGNCGSGPIKVGPYYDKVDSAGAGTNVAHLLPQGALRNAVLGTAQRPATAAELEQMKELVSAAMQDGAWGMSTGLIYVPSSYADTAELTELARVVAAAGGLYASHVRGEGVGLLSSVNEAIEIGRQAKLPVHISHFKSAGQDAWGLVRKAAEQVEKARGEGQTVTADQYPYIASSTSLEATLIPTWARAGGQKELVKRLDNPEVAPQVLKAISTNLANREEGRAIRIARYAPRQDWVGLSLFDIAKREGRKPLDVVVEITRKGGAAVVNFSMSEEDVRHIMQIAWVATASDGSAYLPGADRPHPRNYGTFARKIGHYSLREEVLPLAQAVRSASGLPADILGLEDRGYLRVDAFADVVVFDPQAFIDTATFDNPHRYAVGMRYVLVNGKPAVFEGTPTGALAGKALRHKPAAADGEAADGK